MGSSVRKSKDLSLEELRVFSWNEDEDRIRKTDHFLTEDMWFMKIKGWGSSIGKTCVFAEESYEGLLTKEPRDLHLKF